MADNSAEFTFSGKSSIPHPSQFLSPSPSPNPHPYSSLFIHHMPLVVCRSKDVVWMSSWGENPLLLDVLVGVWLLLPNIISHQIPHSHSLHTDVFIAYGVLYHELYVDVDISDSNPQIPSVWRICWNHCLCLSLYISWLICVDTEWIHSNSFIWSIVIF